jgi:citrate/tricarballylate utilization protein
MSFDAARAPTPVEEARRQIEICNACRYCEGFCSVFPAIARRRTFTDGDVTQLANLCHNCRGCYYACQYAEPHAFAVNLPRALAEVRVESWERFAWPARFAELFQRRGLATAAALVAAITAIWWALTEAGDAPGFYAHLSHAAMVSIFVPAFLFPLAAVAVALRRYWRAVGGAPVRGADLMAAAERAARLRDLSGGQGQGCNFEKGDRFSNARRHAHQAAAAGFLLCFASTVSGTVMHYVLDWPAPYPFLSAPKLLGVPGGLLLLAGTVALLRLKLSADRALGAPDRWSGELAFLLLLAGAAATGLALYAATGTALVRPLLALHLGAVLTFFLTMPYSKMAHGFFRFAAILRDAQTRAR